MKIYVKSAQTTGSYREKDDEVYKNKNYFVQYNFVDSIDEDEIFEGFEAQVTETHPYDDANYYWAQIKDGVISYIQDGTVKDKEYYFTSSDMGVEPEDWCDEIVSMAIEHLYNLNESIEPEMSYD